MNYDPFETCPYDPVHRILRSKLQYHLTKCSKNFSKSKKKRCLFDACHIVDSKEYNHHIDNCSSRECVTHFKLKETDNQLNFVKIEPHVMDDDKSSWENEASVKSYNPLKNIEERPIARCLMGASKSERKKFQKNERSRIQKLENDRENQNKFYEKNDTKPKTNTAKSIQDSKNYSKEVVSSDLSEQIEQEYKPLRPPKNLQSNNLLSNSNTGDQSHTVQKKLMQYSEIVKTVASSNIPSKNSQQNINSNVIDNKKESWEIKKNLDAQHGNDDENMFDKLSKIVEKIDIKEQGYEKKMETLNKNEQILKKNSTLNNKSNLTK